MSRKKILWLTASYFLDVDLPVVPALKSYFDIDWVLITNESNREDDVRYIESQTDAGFKTICDTGLFFSPSHYRVMKNMIESISEEKYDLFYFDISDLLFLFPLIRRNLPIEKVIIAAHNVSIPKGARYAPLARRTMRYILKYFSNFQTFSKNQRDVLKSIRPDANVLYAPLMLKDYGKAGNTSSKTLERGGNVNFLFFGNIVEYKRLDVLLEAVNILFDKGIRNFKVYICGYCQEKVWKTKYQPMINHSELFHLDIRRIPTDKVAEYFEECQYFVMPYQDIAQSGAMTVALNYDMPIIASDLPTFHEFLTGEGDSYFFKPGDAADLASKMEYALENSPEEYRHMRDSVKESVERNFSSEVIISKYVDYIKSTPLVKK